MKVYTTNNYTIQCTDQLSGKTGCFLFDEKKWVETGKFFAVGPVYPDLVEFFKNTPADKHGERRLERETETKPTV